jgi:cytochrome b561
MIIAAKIAHALLYLLLLITLISGYLISTADGRAIELFNLINIPALPFAIDNQEDLAGLIHFIVATILISLAAIHAIAALKHHFIDKDITLKRMLALREE